MGGGGGGTKTPGCCGGRGGIPVGKLVSGGGAWYGVSCCPPLSPGGDLERLRPREPYLGLLWRKPGRLVDLDLDLDLDLYLPRDRDREGLRES